MPRSGTTLVQEHLARHPDVVATPETHFFSKVCHSPRLARRKLDPPTAGRVYRCLRRSLGDAAVEEDEGSAALPSGGATVAEVARAAFMDRLAASGRALIIEKTPDHALYLDAIAAVFPSASVIFVVRDPRDVSLSWMGLPWNPAGPIYPGIRWRSVDRAMRAAQCAAKLRIETVVYESFLQQPVSELRRLQRFLGVSVRDDLSEVTPGASTFDASVEYWKSTAALPVDRSRTGRWETEMSKAHQFLYQCMLRHELRRSGYAPSNIGIKDIELAELARAIAGELPAVRLLPGLWLRHWRWLRGLRLQAE
jgi:hypothetical protein